jgi:hypothetical protein
VIEGKFNLTGIVCRENMFKKCKNHIQKIRKNRYIIHIEKEERKSSDGLTGLGALFLSYSSIRDISVIVFFFF